MILKQQTITFIIILHLSHLVQLIEDVNSTTNKDIDTSRTNIYSNNQHVSKPIRILFHGTVYNKSKLNKLKQMTDLFNSKNMAEHLKGIVDSEYDFDYDEDGELLRLNPEMLYGDEASFKTFIREFYNAISKFITRILMGGFYAYISFMGSKLFFTMSNKTAHMLHCGQFFKNCDTNLDRDKKNNHPWWYIPLIFGDRNDPVIMHYNKFVLINRQLFMSLCILFVIIFQIEMIWCSINIIRYERKCNDSSTIRYHERSNSEQPTSKVDTTIIETNPTQNIKIV